MLIEKNKGRIHRSFDLLATGLTHLSKIKKGVEERVHPVGQTIGLGIAALGYPLLGLQAGMSLALYKATENIPANEFKSLVGLGYIFSELLLIVANGLNIYQKGYCSELHTNILAVPLGKKSLINAVVASVAGSIWKNSYLLATDSFALADWNNSAEQGSYFASNFATKLFLSQLVFNGANAMIHKGMEDKMIPVMKKAIKVMGNIKNGIVDSPKQIAIGAKIFFNTMSDLGSITGYGMNKQF
ncbi:MAG: hypothetical protein Q7R95_01100 [bacterium]|nr:hypothetical protein [bacterium]